MNNKIYVQNDYLKGDSRTRKKQQDPNNRDAEVVKNEWSALDLHSLQPNAGRAKVSNGLT